MAEIKALVGDKVLGKNGLEEVEELCKDADAVGLYFSAHWCPPCKAFTPIFANFYKQQKKDGKKFQVIFVSSDRTEDDFNGYFKEMPWHALPFGSDKKQELSDTYGIRGIPSLVILGPDGKVRTREGRKCVTENDWESIKGDKKT